MKHPRILGSIAAAATFVACGDGSSGHGAGALGGGGSGPIGAAGAGAAGAAGGGGAAGGETTAGAGGEGGAGGATLCAPSATQPCYSGPVDTAGVGACQAGMQTCSADGSSWSSCMGEVVPIADDCATPADEDCSGSAAICPVDWNRVMPQVSSIGLDAAGNLYGSFYNNGAPFDFGAGPVMASAAFVKFAPDGSVVWQQPSSEVLGEFAILGSGFAVQAEDGIKLLDSLGNETDFLYTGGPWYGRQVIAAVGPTQFVTEYPTGTIVMLDGLTEQWTYPVGAAHVGMTVDGLGSVVFCTDLPNGLLRIGKLSSAGSLLWANDYSADVVLHGCTADSNGGVIFYGWHGTVDFGGGPIPSAPGPVVVKLDSAGAHQWSRAVEMNGAPGAWAVGPADSLLYFTAYMGAPEIDGVLLPDAGSTNPDLVLARFDDNGDLLQVSAFGSPGFTEMAYGLVSTPLRYAMHGKLFGGPVGSGPLDLGLGPISGPGEPDFIGVFNH